MRKCFYLETVSVGNKSHFCSWPPLIFSYCLYFISFDSLPHCIDYISLFTAAAHVESFLGSSCPSGGETALRPPMLACSTYYSSLLSPSWQQLMSHITRSYNLGPSTCLCFTPSFKPYSFKITLAPSSSSLSS